MEKMTDGTCSILNDTCLEKNIMDCRYCQLHSVVEDYRDRVYRKQEENDGEMVIGEEFVRVFLILSASIRREIEHWKVINQNGCNDPFWSDGCNMNLTRNHIIYYQSKIHEICTENQLPLPEECYFSIPPEVDNNYMANLKQKPRVERLRQLGRIMTGRIYQYDENQMSLF